MNFPTDYAERVYAGVLGKIVGVYLGRPFEGQSYEWLTERFGEVNRYVHEDLDKPLIVADDDISGTFTFVRALEDNGYSPDLSCAQIGEGWLNYIIEDQTVLWWGGMGVSTEHTAYLRLKAGMRSPESGSIETNGRVVAEQIGSQIFIDSWGLLFPGDPEHAADFAARAARVSHDGEAVYGAQVVAALVAAAFAVADLGDLLAAATALIPSSCGVARLIQQVQEWRTESDDWRVTFKKIASQYGYDRYGGGCHLIPNHALIILALVHGDRDFDRSLMIANTAGWDTDCNSGNVGCILGVRNGLAAFAGTCDWRGPVRDRLLLPTADGARAFTDAVRETDSLVRAAHSLHRVDWSAPKSGARYHFSYPGSAQGFAPTSSGVRLVNPSGALVMAFEDASREHPAGATTPVFMESAEVGGVGYGLAGSPSVYPGQNLRACFSHELDDDLRANFLLRFHGENDLPQEARSEPVLVAPNTMTQLEFFVPQLGSQPLFELGMEVAGETRAISGEATLHWLAVEGVPSLRLGAPVAGSEMARRAWICDGDTAPPWHLRNAMFPHALLANNRTAMQFIGEFGWTSYEVRARGRSHLAETFGLLFAVQGLRRHLAVRLTRSGAAELVQVHDGCLTVLAQAAVSFEPDRTYQFVARLGSDGRVMAKLDDIVLAAQVQPDRARGAAGFTVSNGVAQFQILELDPAELCA